MMNFLILVAVVLLIAAVAQILRIFELSGNLRGKKGYEVTDGDNRTQALLMLVFLVVYFGFIIYQLVAWGGKVLPQSASVHGEDIDSLMTISWWIISPVFVITHILLFYFAYKYAYNKDRRADFFAHSNKLEMFWTAVPTVVLAALILYGLSTWNEMMEPIAEEEEPVLIELYSRQFDWTARYPGADRKFGDASFRMIGGSNSLGIDENDVNAKDDIIVKDEFLLPVNQAVQFRFRSQDVIHSAFMPHFRAQMNCVPGMITQFNFIPKYTTAEMKEITGNEEFEYILLCNKICGAAHYNMQMKIVVVSEEDYQKWLSEKEPFMPEVKEEVSADNNADPAAEMQEEELLEIQS
jgi:cytochrome c oxidase subunit 2